MKKDLVSKYSKNKEDTSFIASVLDKADACLEKNIQTNTNFLDLRQQTIVNSMKNEFGVNGLLYGGFEDAERKILIFMPPYADEINKELLCFLEIEHSGYNKLSHRDYLGSVLGLGIKREKIGDILVYEKSAKIIILQDIKDFILTNYQKAGKTNLTAQFKPIQDLTDTMPTQKTKIITDTVSSLRLDAVVSTAFGLSRTNAVKGIESGNVFVNGLEILKPDKQINKNDKITFRKKGKAVLIDVGGTSKKGRIFIKIEIYL